MSITKQEKVVLVVTDGRDYSIKEISEWLLYYTTQLKFQLIVLNVSDNDLEIKKGNINAKTDLTFGISNTDIEFKLSAVIGILFRQAALRIYGHTGVISNSGTSTDIRSRVYNYLMAHEANIRWLLLNLFSEKNIIGFDSGSFINKLDVLRIAAETGLKIPPTILTSDKADLLDFYHRQKKQLITKSIGIGLKFFDLENNQRFHQLTHLLNDDDFKKIPDRFSLTLVQKSIEKKFEIRTFYLDGICYSWALLSQSNEKTRTDYRNYDWDNPTRVIPFALPDQIERKVHKLMKRLQLRTGSIDFIYSAKGEYIFLEVNPAGQYGHNSDASNTSLDKKIAESLIFNNERKKHRTNHS